jgi:hypothetical protein
MTSSFWISQERFPVRPKSKRQEEALVDDVLQPDPALGQPETARGGIGRGAEGLAAILEWVGAVIATGVVGEAA